MRKGIIFGLVSAFSLAFDQWSKVWARNSLGASRKQVIDGFWDFQLSQNERGAFGFNIPGGRWSFVVVGIVALAFIIAYLRKPEAVKLRVLIPLGLIAGGAIGNIYDRVAFGTVTDFIHWHIRQRFSWPTFNIADAALVAGVLALLLFAPKKKPKEAGKGEQAAAK